MGMGFKKKLFLVWILGGFILFSDQLSKILIRSSGGFYICNPYIAFGLKIPAVLFWIFWLGIIFLIFHLLYKKPRPFEALCLIFILSGALSNLVDRISGGCIIDFIDLGFWPIFNLADFFITLGAIMLAIIYLKTKH